MRRDVVAAAILGSRKGVEAARLQKCERTRDQLQVPPPLGAPKGVRDVVGGVVLPAGPGNVWKMQQSLNNGWPSALSWRSDKQVRAQRYMCKCVADLDAPCLTAIRLPHTCHKPDSKQCECSMRCSLSLPFTFKAKFVSPCRQSLAPCTPRVSFWPPMLTQTHLTPQLSLHCLNCLFTARDTPSPGLGHDPV